MASPDSRFPAPGLRLRATRCSQSAILCGGRGLGQAGCVAACPAAGCSIPQSVIMRIKRGAFPYVMISTASEKWHLLLVGSGIHVGLSAL